MTLRKTLLATFAALVLSASGCIGGWSPTGGPVGDDDDDMTPQVDAGVDVGPNARAVFDESVAPILAMQCSGASCHGGIGNSPLKFLTGDTTGFYDIVTSYDDRVVGYFDKTSAPMLDRVSPGPHYTAVYTAADIAAISDWMDAELAARNGGVPPPPDAPTPGQVSKALMAEWSGCMELTAWDEEQVAVRWANKGSGEGPCIRCHVNGQASFLATDDSLRMFDILTTNKYYMLSYFSPNVTDLANAKMEINRAAFERVGNGEFPYIEHPGFDVDGQAYESLVLFYDRTMARKAAGLCDPPRLLEE